MAGLAILVAEWTWPPCRVARGCLYGLLDHATSSQSALCQRANALLPSAVQTTDMAAASMATDTRTRPTRSLWRRTTAVLSIDPVCGETNWTLGRRLAAALSRSDAIGKHRLGQPNGAKVNCTFLPQALLWSCAIFNSTWHAAVERPVDTRGRPDRGWPPRKQGGQVVQACRPLSSLPRRSPANDAGCCLPASRPSAGGSYGVTYLHP